MLERNSNKSFTDVLLHSFDAHDAGFCCMKVGKIVSFNSANQTADIEILHKFTNPNINVAKELINYPVLKQVPCIILGGGNSHITFPISKGDNCLVFFCDHEIDGWWISGEARPSTWERKHNISDSFALVGVHSLADLISGYSSYLNLKYSDNSSITIGESIDVNNQTVNLNGKTTANDLHSKTGATGTFTNVNGNTLTIVDGIITKIS